jgi:hypothetical protein
VDETSLSPALRLALARGLLGSLVLCVVLLALVQHPAGALLGLILGPALGVAGWVERRFEEAEPGPLRHAGAALIVFTLVLVLEALAGLQLIYTSRALDQGVEAGARGVAEAVGTLPARAAWLGGQLCIPALACALASLVRLRRSAPHPSQGWAWWLVAGVAFAEAVALATDSLGTAALVLLAGAAGCPMVLGFYRLTDLALERAGHTVAPVRHVLPAETPPESPPEHGALTRRARPWWALAVVLCWPGAWWTAQGYRIGAEADAHGVLYDPHLTGGYSMRPKPGGDFDESYWDAFTADPFPLGQHELPAFFRALGVQVYYALH